MTTLDVCRSIETLQIFVKEIFEPSEREVTPEWMNTIVFADDNEQVVIIEQSNAEIEAAKNKIIAAEEKLAENSKFKSILYTNGDELVSVVYEILEQLLNVDLSEFVDVNKEDFLIRLSECTFIGEIKGVTSNVKNENVAQIEQHYQEYMDKLEEEQCSEVVKQLLIMNPFRTKPINQREPINEKQISLAIRNGCLIIETITLLRVFEKFLTGEITSERCFEVFASKTGLLTLTDFE